MTEKLEALEWPQNGLESVPCCPVCGEEKRKRLHTNMTDRVYFCAPGEWSLFQCKSCASAYLDPRPNIETIGMAYETYHTHESFSAPSRTFSDKLKLKLRNGYFNYRYGTKLYPENRLGIIAAFFMRNRRKVLDLTLRHLPKAKLGSSLLDLGCGNGYFLSYARNAGWDVVGVDLDPKAVSVATQNGLDVRLGSIDIIDSSKEQFDVITLSHVIEHVHQPIDVLNACYKLLKPGGFLWIETPNIESEGHRIFGRYWRGLEPPRHLVLFTYKSLLNTLTKVGYAEVELQPYRLQCEGLFQSSKNVMHYDKSRQFEKKSSSLVLRSLVKKSEKIAKRDPSKREFITVKAWKK